MLDYKLLEALAAVIQQQSFERAADLLCLTQSAVSQRIRLLEERLGQPVLIRANPIRPTDLGLKLFHHVQQVQLLEQALSEDVRPEGEKYTHMRLAVNGDSMSLWLMPVLAEFFHSHQVVLELIVEDQDCTLARLKAGEVIGCVSAQDTQVAGCNRQYLGTTRYVWVCSPRFRDRFFSKGVTQDSLRAAPAIIFNRDDQLHWRYLREHYQLGSGDIYYHTIPTVDGYISAIERDMGIGFIAEDMVADALASGEMINPTPERHFDVDLYWHHWRLNTPLVAHLTTLLFQQARESLIWQPPGS
ncbi:LysR family transcriptional regulator ArgP [Pokkaliibacter sp. CJK22405]|uniref:LysR family transcriptional regulator ArgP n=1 Tax=Pokkaliibacter sp. CJK22405 TaxID=3384615 RepID=UPI003984D2FF